MHLVTSLFVQEKLSFCRLLKNAQIKGALPAHGTGHTAQGGIKTAKTLSLVP
jgi:hypothetical protein